MQAAIQYNKCLTNIHYSTHQALNMQHAMKGPGEHSKQVFAGITSIYTSIYIMCQGK
jgi:hypothetical protein